jgi:predicted kinase
LLLEPGDHGRVYLVVTGPPASGKSALARVLAVELGLPLVAKDEIKKSLFVFGTPTTVQESQKVGRAAVQAMLSAARSLGHGVLDSVWVDRERAVRELTALGVVVEVFCRCDRDVMAQRYRERAPGRGPGHFDLDRDHDELWAEGALHPLRGPWRVLEVDTSRPLEVDDVRRLVEALRV